MPPDCGGGFSVSKELRKRVESPLWVQVPYANWWIWKGMQQEKIKWYGLDRWVKWDFGGEEAHTCTAIVSSLLCNDSTDYHPIGALAWFTGAKEVRCWEESQLSSIKFWKSSRLQALLSTAASLLLCPMLNVHSSFDNFICTTLNPAHSLTLVPCCFALPLAELYLCILQWCTFSSLRRVSNMVLLPSELNLCILRCCTVCAVHHA